MEYTKLIEALRNCSSAEGTCAECSYKSRVYQVTCNGCKWDMMHDAADALEAADKRIAELEKQDSVESVPSAWISVKDRLPEPRFAREWYLVALESGCVMTLAFEKAENRWHETGSPVTHWMPLPDAPEEELEECGSD